MLDANPTRYNAISYYTKLSYTFYTLTNQLSAHFKFLVFVLQPPVSLKVFSVISRHLLNQVWMDLAMCLKRTCQALHILMRHQQVEHKL
jgi:hypothetical protein